MTEIDPLKPVEQFLSPLGRILLDLRKIRESARNDISKLPGSDPMKGILDSIDRILASTEDAIIRTAKRPPGMDALTYIQQEVRRLEEEIGKAQALPGEIVRKTLPLPRRRLK